MPTYNGTEIEDLTPEKLSEAYASCCAVAWEAAAALDMTACNTHLVFARHILGVLFEGLAGAVPDGATIN